MDGPTATDPIGYVTTLQEAEDRLITVENIEAFVVEKPWLDRPARSNSSRWWFEKLVTNNTVIKSSTIPQGWLSPTSFIIRSLCSPFHTGRKV